MKMAQNIVDVRDNDVKQKGMKSEPLKDDNEDLRCGFGSCKPSWLQIFNNPKFYLFLLCCFAFVQGFVVNGINNVNVTAIERRFDLPSTRVGLVSSAYDFSAGVFAIPIGFLGTYGNQPRILCVTAFVMALGSFVMTIPHFATGIYELGAKEAETCTIGNTTVCVEEDSNLQNYLYVLILGQVLHGVGGQTLYSLGIVFLDANVRSRSSPLYMGFLQASSVLGPAVGFLLGGVFLNRYTDFNVVDVDSLSVDPEDPRWVGAWWLGFLVGGCLAIVVVFALSPYARMLPSSREVQAERISECHQNGSEDIASKENFGRSLKDIPKMLLLLIKNPVFTFSSLASVSEGILVAGFATFLPKYVQNQFLITPGAAAILTGFITIPAAAGGTMFGALICRCFKLKVKGMMRFCAGLTTVSGLLCLLFLVKCTPFPFAGVTVPYFYDGVAKPDVMSTVDVSFTCNNNCGCSQNAYTPVCGADNIQYFSACHAGCENETESDGTNVYHNCSCILRNGTVDLSVPDAKQGACEGECSTDKVTYPFIFLLVFFTLSVTVPVSNTCMRVVPDNMRSMAIGSQWVVSRFLGTVPGPILFGVAFDAACVVWREQCDSRGSCWIYDSDKVGVNMTLLGVIIRVFSTIFFLIALFSYKAPPEESPTVNGKDKAASVYDNPAMDLDDDTHAAPLETKL